MILLKLYLLLLLRDLLYIGCGLMVLFMFYVLFFAFRGGNTSTEDGGKDVY